MWRLTILDKKQVKTALWLHVHTIYSFFWLLAQLLASSLLSGRIPHNHSKQDRMPPLHTEARHFLFPEFLIIF